MKISDVFPFYIRWIKEGGDIYDKKRSIKSKNKLKQKLKEEGNETVTKCHQLKLKAKDGKYRSIDVAILVT